jgi:hypothetical protein
MPTTTTWQRQALSNQTTPINTTRFQETISSNDDQQLHNEYLAVKMQLEMKKRAIERDKQRLETMRDNKRQTISQEAFKQLLQQKTRNTSALTNEFLSSPQSTNHQIRKSQTTSEFRSQTNTPPLQQPISIESKKDESSIVDLSKPMTRDEFLNTLELLKQKYIETTTTATTPTVIEENRNDEGRRIEQLNSNIGELQQVINDREKSKFNKLKRSYYSQYCVILSIAIESHEDQSTNRIFFYFFFSLDNRKLQTICLLFCFLLGLNKFISKTRRNT